MRDPHSNKADGILCALLGFGTFVIYAIGACRTIYVGDSGELVAAVDLLGIPHPSGYPLYVILGKLWTLLVPIGSIAFRMSLFSAACASVTVALFYSIVRRLGVSNAVAACSTLVFAFGPSFWSQANIQRVYTLNAMFVAIATTLALRWFERRKPRCLALAFFACGLGASNHTFMVVYAFALAIAVVILEPAIIRAWRTVTASAGSFVAGLSVYAFLPLRSRMDPRLDWGNPETWENFKAVVGRQDFWDRKWVETFGDLLQVVADWVWSLGVETAWVGPALALIAIVLLAHRVPRKWWKASLDESGSGESRIQFAAAILALGVMAGNLFSMALHGSRSDIFIWHRYYVPSYFMLMILASLGLEFLAKNIPKKAIVLGFGFPALLLLTGWNQFDRSEYRIGEDFSRTLLNSLPPGSTLMANDDNILFVLIYLHHVEGLRPDVNLILQGVSESTPPQFSFNPDEDPVFFTHHPNWSIPQLEIIPQGLVYRAWRAGTPWPPAKIATLALEGEDDPGVPKDYLTQNLVGHFHFMLGVTFENADWVRAREQFDLAVKYSPSNDVLFYNLGLIYSRNGLFDRALDNFKKANEINNRGIPRSQIRQGESEKRSVPADRIREMEGEIARIDAVRRKVEASHSEVRGLEGAAWHREMARLLRLEGELLAARGHELRAIPSTER